MANDLVELLDHLNISTASLIGWSMGGVIAQSLALSHPHRVRQLVLLGTCSAPDGYLRAAITNWVNMRLSNIPYEHTVRHLARMVCSPALVNNTKAYEAFVQIMIANPYRQSQHGFIRQTEALLSHTTPSELSRIQIPTSVLVGEYDQLTPPYMSKELVALIPGATLNLLPGAHSGFMEHPERYNQALLEALVSGAGTNSA